ncbi:unnamed protein product [Musa textilis]
MISTEEESGVDVGQTTEPLQIDVFIPCCIFSLLSYILHLLQVNIFSVQFLCLHFFINSKRF